MRYVVLVHKDEGSAYGVIVPDVPGCYSAGDTFDEAMRNTAEAIDFHLDGAGLPPVRSVEEILADASVAEALAGTTLAAVTDRDNDNVPIDHALAERLDQAAMERGMSRAAFVDRVLREALEET
ncbi:type II toxin-antitoxin system HicB family antitoxin [Acuticoccus sp.]|uniref:type II toxin-antitoxin system HicB family antitoxin n=1 Tax=Acuticoccus sp. TaxID=1904378 RepID=UPI003B52B15D